MRRSVHRGETGGDRCQGRGFDLSDAEALGRLRQGPGWGSPQRMQCGAQDRSQDMQPLMRLALTPPEQSPLHDLAGVRFQVDQDQPQSIFWRRPRTVLIGRVPASGARLAIQAPGGPMRWEGCLKRRNPLLQLLQGETGPIQHLRGAGLDVGESSRAPGCARLS